MRIKYNFAFKDSKLSPCQRPAPPNILVSDASLQKKIISSQRPVIITFEDICIEGKNFEINNNGDKIKFTDGVNLIIGENTRCIMS